jgi:hypothetical protein
MSHLLGWKVYEVTPTRAQVKLKGTLGAFTFSAETAVEAQLEIANANKFRVILLISIVAASRLFSTPWVAITSDNWTMLMMSTRHFIYGVMSIIQNAYFLLPKGLSFLRWRP